MLPVLLPDWLQRESLKNPYNVVHYDTYPGVCRNLTDGSC